MLCCDKDHSKVLLPICGLFYFIKKLLEANFMKKITFDYTPPVFNFLFSHLRKRKDFEYERNTLGGAISFTS